MKKLFPATSMPHSFGLNLGSSVGSLLVDLILYFPV